jgi:hypothetical protein
MAIDISQFLNSPPLAAAKVEPRGTHWRAASRQYLSPLAMLIAPLVARVLLGPKPELGGAQTPVFNLGMLAVTKDELVLVNLTHGLKVKPTGVLGRVPLGEVQSCELKRARMTSPLTITFRDGGSWRLEVAPLDLGDGKRLAAAVSGQSQVGQRIPGPVSDS